MAIRVRAQSATQALLNVENQLDELDEVAGELFAEVGEDISPHVLDDLRYYPPPAKHPFDFATPKSKRFYFWAVGTGQIPTSGGRYKRTGGLGEGWRIRIGKRKGAYEFVIENVAKNFQGKPFAKYVVGSFDVRRGPKYQVPGHRNTGWPLVAPTVSIWTQTFIDQYSERLADTVEGALENVVVRSQHR